MDELKKLKDDLSEALDGIKRLKGKNDELLDKLRKVKDEKINLETAKEKADREAKEQGLLDEKKYEELIDTLKKGFETDKQSLVDKMSEITNDAAKSKSALREILVDSGLKEKFLAVGVKDAALLKACTKLHSDKAELAEVDGKSVVLIDGKPVDEFIEVWKDSDGKSFISAGLGGGDSGSKTSGGSATGEWERFFKPETKNLTKQLELKGEDEDLYNTLKARYQVASNPLVAR